MRGSLGGLPARSSGDGNPAIAAACTLTGLDTTAGATPLTATLATPIALDGWTLAGNVLTCGVPGVYRMDMQAELSQSGANTAALGFRVNGGTDQRLVQISVTDQIFTGITRLFKFAAGDTFEVRLVGSGGSNGQLARLAVSLVQISTFQ